MSSSDPCTDVAALSRGASSHVSTPMPGRKWKTRVLLPAGVLALAGGLLAYTGAEALRPAIDVEVVPVVLKAGAVGGAPRADAGAGESKGGAKGGVVAQAPGWIEPDPYAVNVPALADGVVKEVLVLEGETVKEGQVVARLIDDDARLEIARAEADSREKMAEVIVADADKMEAQMIWENRTELIRDAAVAGATLEEVRAELARLPLEIDAQAAKLAELRDDLTRKDELVSKHAVAEADVAQLRQRVKGQEADLEAAKAMRPVLEAKVKIWQAEVTAAQEHLRLRIRDTKMMASANAKYEAAKAGAARADAMREESRLRLSRMDVRSPVSGVVMTRLVEPGSKVMAQMDNPGSSWVIRVYNPKKLQVRVDVPLASAGSLGVGMPAEISVEALPERVFKGKVTRVVHEANIQKNTVQVKVAIEDPAPELKPEMLTRVKLFAIAGESGGPQATATERGEGTAGSGMIMAPAGALVAGTDGLAPGASARAWVLDQSRNEAQQRSVRLGRRSESSPDWIEVTEGLRPGDRLIAGDVSRLREGAKVRVMGEKKGGEHGVH